MRDMGYGKGYRHAHDEEGGYVRGEDYLPETIVGTQFYHPNDRGYEARNDLYRARFSLILEMRALSSALISRISPLDDPEKHRPLSGALHR